MVRPLTVIAAASAHATQEARRSVISRWPSIGWIGPSDGSREPESAVSMLITRAISATASMMPYPRDTMLAAKACCGASHLCWRAKLMAAIMRKARAKEIVTPPVHRKMRSSGSNLGARLGITIAKAKNHAMQKANSTAEMALHVSVILLPSLIPAR